MRSKVRVPGAAGRVERRGRGYPMATANAARDLAPATDATLRYLARMGSVCIDAVRREGEQLQDKR